MTTTAAEDTRTLLLGAIEELRARETTPAVRIALAEAEFRLAIAPDTEPAEAIDRLNSAIEADPFCPKLFLHLGRLLHRSGRPAAALSEYRHAVRLAPASRRAHLLLALALTELGKATRELGDLVIAALNGGPRSDLSALRVAVAEVDAWLAEQTADDEKKSPRPAAKQAKQCAPDAWRVTLYEQVVRGGKTQAGQLSVLLAAGLARVADAGEIGEFVTACVLLLASGQQQPRKVREFAKPVLAEHADHPAVVLLDAALNLAEAGEPATFVAMATDYLDRGVLPGELVCWLHLAAHGPQQPGPTALDALSLLNRYPRSIRDLDCFEELTLAVLDGHARRAWADERFAEARLLWQEAGSIDRLRVPIALNLALLAARTRSAEDYGPAWDRLSELLYLHAAGAGDVQLLLEDRRTLHLALAQQAQLRHCASAGARDTQTAEEIEAWLADTDALDMWLRQWDLYYVNARLGFRSPVHLLGVPVNAEAEDLAVARDAFARHVQLALRESDWAGVAVFAQLAVGQAGQAHVAITAEESRDAYYETERARAQALAEVALGRGLTLRRMMRALLQRRSADQLKLGFDLARRQLALPWRVLRPICVERGLIGDNVDPVKMFVDDLVHLAEYGDDLEAADDHDRRLAALDDCVVLLPDRLELRLLRCRALRAADRDTEAYAAALEALELPAPEDDEGHKRMTSQLVNLVNDIGWEAIPESVRNPRNAAAAPTLPAVIASARQALELFPRSGAVRRELARLLVKTGGVNETNEAIELLSEGLEVALSAEWRTKFTEQLAAIKSVAATVSIRASIRQLVEPAEEAVRAAIREYVQNTDPETKQAMLAAMRAAIVQVTEARRIAEQAQLTDECASLDDKLDGLRQRLAELADEEE